MDGDSTVSIHADRGLSDLPDVAPAIRTSTTFAEGTGRRYRRTSHETTERFEAVIGALEGGHAIAYASGMAAAAAAIDHLRPNRIALPPKVYHGVRALITRLADVVGIGIVEPSALDEGDLWWIETPSNPYGDISDLDLAVARARERGARVVCDATLATPVCLRPLSFGVDIVLHASTKAIAGHSDAMGGVLVTSDAVIAGSIADERNITGAIPGSLDVWLALRGVRTLPLRMARACTSASAIAELLAAHGLPTFHPSLPSHPGHAVAERQMLMPGSVLAVEFDRWEAAESFIAALRLFTNATSLGGIESLAERRAVSDPTMPEGLVRLSIGIEDTADLVDDVARALDVL
jgi:cystathionine gamma-synthase